MKSVIRKMLYLYSDIISFILGKNRKSKKILREYKNKYSGKRCFIVGNGPSLTVSDLEMIKDEYSFASNRIYKIFDKTVWRPNFYAVIDEGVFRSEGVLENVNLMKCEMKFFRREGFYAYKKAKGNNCFIKSYYSRKYLEKPLFSEDLVKGAYTIATVTYFMIQIARYMGFKDIYLLGMDNNYNVIIERDGQIKINDGVRSYFSEEKENIEKKAVPVWEQNVAFQYADKYSKNNGFRIYNATRGGKLEDFERVILEDIL